MNCGIELKKQSRDLQNKYVAVYDEKGNYNKLEI